MLGCLSAAVAAAGQRGRAFQQQGVDERLRQVAAELALGDASLSACSPSATLGGRPKTQTACGPECSFHDKLPGNESG